VGKVSPICIAEALDGIWSISPLKITAIPIILAILTVVDFKNFLFNVLNINASLFLIFGFSFSAIFSIFFLSHLPYTRSLALVLKHHSPIPREIPLLQLLKEIF
jgi:hypothetical protein